MRDTFAAIQLNKPYNPPANYRLLAGSYFLWEHLVFAGQLQKCRLSFYQELERSKNLLLLGDGDGRFSTHILKTIPGIKITSLDASAAMLKAAKNRRTKNGISEDRVTAIREDILHWAGKGRRYDSVVAQFFFDSFEANELSRIAGQLKKVLDPGGKLLVSEWGCPKSC